MKKRQIYKLLSISMIAIAIFGLIACSSSSDDTDDSGVTVKVSADFNSNASVLSSYVSCPNPAPSTDGPTYAPGADCDNDGRIVRYVTPSNYKVAFKSLSFIKDDGTTVNIIEEASTLATSQVVDITSPFTVTQNAALPVGTYTTMNAVIYYVELSMEMNVASQDQSIRIYLSDDNFPAEGSLGHHQGDVLLVSNNAVQGFVAPGQAWISANLLSSRGNTEGGGGVDAQTGHKRGLYGDTTLWNQAAFNQGANQDEYIINRAMNLSVAAGDGEIVTITFDVGNSWFYEDSDNDQLFDPCNSNTDACSSNSEWTPILELPSVTVE